MKKYSTTQKDFYRQTGKWISGFDMLKACYNPNLLFIFWFRKASKHPQNTFLGKLYRLILRRYQIRYGYQIYAGTDIGEGFLLGHWGGHYIGSEVKIGKNCNAQHGTSIGGINTGRLKGMPTIGDDVWIGPFAIIVGKINIGNNVLIAGNSFVNFDVPSNSIVAGNPAKIIPNDQATLGYVNNRI